MALANELTSWLLKKADQLNLKVTRLSWPNDWSITDLYDYRASIEVAGQKIVGCGISTNEEESALKACAEAIERAYCVGLGLHSTGVAVHSDRSHAKENAVDELFERSLFFAHFYSRTPFALLNREVTASLEAKFAKVFERVGVDGGTIRFFGTKTIGDRFGVLALAEQNGLPIAIGLGTKANAGDSVTHAFLECVGSLSFQKTLPNARSLTLEEFRNLKEPTPFDRQALLRAPEYWSENKFLFADSESLLVENSRAFEFDCELEELSAPFSVLAEAPVFAYRARPTQGAGPDRIEYGDLSGLTWLSQFWGHEIRLTASALRPHFLG